MADEIARCEICGEPMPPGEHMFKFHGYSGNCPKPPLQTTLVVVEAGIRRRGDDYFVFMGDQEIECDSLEQAERMYADMNAMVKQAGGDVLPPRSN